MQKWTRLNFYVEDFLNLVYRYYAEHGIAYICTYYHLDLTNSICDKSVLDGASYETIGDLSGLVWEKILMLPVYNTEEVNETFDADERGFGKFDQRTALNFPSLYGITPTAKDFIKFDELVVNKNDVQSTSPVFQVMNPEKAIGTFFQFWKIYAAATFWTTDQIDSQVRETFVFVDYEKKIYPAGDSQNMLKMLDRQTTIGDKINQSYKSNFGFYLGV